MTITRREVLLGTAGLSAVSLIGGRPATAQMTPVRIPLAQFVQDEVKLTALRRGVAEMKRRRPSDPTSWFFQAAVHGVTDAAIEKAKCEDGDIANVDRERFWNQCPHFGQTSANFLVWHRAYLHYFERILREASGMAGFALPYWDYTVASGRAFPATFAPEYLDAPNNTWPNPLFHSEREAAFALGVVALSESATSIAHLTSETAFFASEAGNSFAGNVGTADQGKVERRPHNGIHFASGGAIGSAAGAMASVTTAAFDPIFWVHHSMIDRLWVEWACLPGRTWGQLPSQAWLGEAPWAFHDADGSIKEEPRRHFFDHRTLGYRYDVEDVNCAPLELPAEIVVAVAPDAAEAVPLVLAEAHAAFVLADAPVAQALAASTDSLPSLAADALGGVSVTLEIADVGIEGVPLNGYDIYVVGDASAPRDRESPSYVGSLALFGVGEHRGGGRHRETQRFAAGTAIAALPARVEPIVVIEPFELLAPSSTPSPEALALGVALPEQRGRVTFSSLRLVSGGQN